ncbi:MAG: Eco47II family restriction endonuclease, partial [Bacteroidetes bacterium]|nr:Eco47II family restriction endonuclease [Bacteroidota bacterium]
DRFYALLSGEEDALFQLYKVLPIAINDYLASIKNEKEVSENSALDEIKNESINSGRSIIDQITFENYPYFLGFDKL